MGPRNELPPQGTGDSPLLAATSELTGRSCGGGAGQGRGEEQTGLSEQQQWDRGVYSIPGGKGEGE